MWQTVTVREVDEVKEREEYEKLRDSELYSNQQVKPYRMHTDTPPKVIAFQVANANYIVFFC